MTEIADPAIVVRGLTVEWPGPRGPRPAVSELDLHVDRGEFVSIVGPSGCGKSTVLRVLAGLLVPDAGSVEIEGRSAVGRPGACAWLPQRDGLLPWRRVLGNAVLGAEIAGIDPAEAESRARGLLRRFGLEGIEAAWPTELSGGMRQRVAVLRTFLAPAPVLLLDEPFGALDALTRRHMQTWLQEVWLNDEAGAAPRRTVVLVTHDVEEALLLSDRVIIMSAGPGTVSAEVLVPATRPRLPSLVADPSFVARRAEVLALLGA